MWEWIWSGETLIWIVLGVFGVRFLIKDVPVLVRIWKNTDKYGDVDPSGNDNAAPRKPYDYM